MKRCYRVFLIRIIARINAAKPASNNNSDKKIGSRLLARVKNITPKAINRIATATNIFLVGRSIRIIKDADIS
ncbi:MAG: hypothetical protein M3N30_05890 [Bacteroidota bacterium]|nr:hypothetical protein [Bacteroidota bacterium]